MQIEQLTPGQARRIISLEGAQNVRDLGGLPLKTGEETKFHAFVRMDDPHQLTEKDLGSIFDWGVRLVVDLRFPQEVRKHPGPFVDFASIAYLNVPMGAQEVDTIPEISNMVDFYRQLLNDCGPSWKRIFDAVLNTQGAVLFHCSAGKDRTGVMSLLLLDLAGVTQAAIVEDYALTEILLAPRLSALRAHRPKEVPEALYDELLRAKPETMEVTYAYLHEKWGGSGGYLASIGINGQALAELKGRLAP